MFHNLYIKASLICFAGVIFAGSFNGGAQAQKPHRWQVDSSGAYPYSYVTSDPIKTRFYTLNNGLTVILTRNTKTPNIVFRMAVRAGSNTDPHTNTGLAHYLEHLLFKGTDRFGTMNFALEKPLLDSIQSLFEVYRHTKDEDQRKQIYKAIDATSLRASSYSIANEYDKIMKAIGSNSSNAYTSSEKTVYIEDLPSNAIDKFLALQSERFRSPVFRNFHTELEVVYEEKNRWLDDDRNQMYQKTLSALFPTHNYGRQTTIGTISDLKNPSLVEIKKYYQKYYVPNNMAIIMAGDFNYDSLIQKIDQNFGYMVARPLVPYTGPEEAPLTKPQVFNLYGPSAENLFVSYRGYPHDTRESLLLNLISSILSNGESGLMDVNINQRQKMLGASASYSQMKDYGVFSLTGSPKQGQTLHEAQQLLLDQIELLKKGQFDEQLTAAIIANRKVYQLEEFENNDTRADNLVEAFTLSKGRDWDKMLRKNENMSIVTKGQIVAFAKAFFKDNYVAVLKHKGTTKHVTKVNKPQITAIHTNPKAVSEFAKTLMEQPVRPIAAKFLDYDKDVSITQAGPAKVICVQNKKNELFRMTYQFDFGSETNKSLPYAFDYLSFLGTDKYASDKIKRLFYNIACSYNIMVGPEKTVISIGGLQQHFDTAVALLEHLLSGAVINTKVLPEFKRSILKSRENAKLNKGRIMAGLTAYAQFGPVNPFNYGLNNDQISALTGEDLVKIIHDLTKYKHKITYFGPKTAADFTAEITKLHPLPSEFLQPPAKRNFEYTNISSPKVYIANYPMVQTEINWVRNIKDYDPAMWATITTFNKYFGDDMGSFVSQKIRESSALAYSTFAMVWTPDSKTKQTTTFAYVGTQADKMMEAITAMDSLLTKLPISQSAFDRAKASIIQELETRRVTNSEIIRSYFADKKLGFTQDGRKLQYEAMQHLTFNDIINYYKQNISGKPYNYCIMGAENKMDATSIKNLGNVTRLSLEQIFGY